MTSTNQPITTVLQMKRTAEEIRRISANAQTDWVEIGTALLDTIADLLKAAQDRCAELEAEIGSKNRLLPSLIQEGKQIAEERITELESALAAEKEARQEAESTAINGFPNQLARISELNAKLATSEAARQEAERQLTRARSLLESGLATINGLVDQQAMSDEFWEVAATDIAYFLAIASRHDWLEEFVYGSRPSEPKKESPKTPRPLPAYAQRHEEPGGVIYVLRWRRIF